MNETAKDLTLRALGDAAEALRGERINPLSTDAEDVWTSIKRVEMIFRLCIESRDSDNDTQRN